MTFRLPIALSAALLLAALLFAPSSHAAEKVRVFILAGQSNMQGKVKVELLDYQIKDPKTADLFAYLHKGGKYTTRDDVLIDYLGKRGGLSPAIGEEPATRYGVEVAFGHKIGDHFDEPVLLIKTAWGGKSIGKDFRPPSKTPTQAEFEQMAIDVKEKYDKQLANYEKKKAAGKKARKPKPAPSVEGLKKQYGFYYREMIKHVNENLAEMGERFPTLAGKDYELSGFVWHQGWNDQYGGIETQYEANMEAFIKDVRKELKAPDLPVVIGVMGQNGSRQPKGPMLTIQQAQLAQQNKPAFKGNVLAVRTDVLVDKAAEKLAPTWRDNQEEWEKIGSDGGYHYYGSAIWHHRIGMAFADAMLGLMGEE